MKPLVDVTLEWAKNFKAPRTMTWVGVSMSFGRKGGTTAKLFTKVLPLSMLKYIIAGKYSNVDSNANCLYDIDDIPKNFNSFLNNLKPISKKVLTEISKEFYIKFRHIYTPTNVVNMRMATLVRLVPKSIPDEPILFETQDDLLKYTYWDTSDPSKRTSHFNIVDDLKKHNILVETKKY